jgi:GntR family transcriptional regulator
MMIANGTLKSRIDRKSPIPFYVQLEEALQEYIDSKSLKPGDQLPGEMTLCEIYDVSRTVVRQALQEMEYEGVIVKEKGRGAFIAEAKISESLVQKLTGFHQDMTAMGFHPVSKILEQCVEPAGAKIAAHLSLSPQNTVIKLTRLRYVQKDPIVLVTTYLPFEKCPGILNEELSSQSLYALLEQKYHLVIAYGRRIIQAVAANEYEAQLLDIKKGAPLISLDSVSYLADSTPIEFYHALHRGDRSQFTVELVRFQQKGDLMTALSTNLVEIPSGHGDIYGPK